MWTQFAIACGHQVTAEAAAEVLRAGGTAADAAVAGALAAMVAEPVLAGLLGGGFAMLAGPRETKLLDFFVQTPRRRARDIDFRAIEADFGTTTQEFHIGAGAVATPGVAPGLVELHARAGRMPLTELAEPACRAAREGVTLTAYQAKLGRIVAPILEATPASRALMCDGAGPLPEGATFRNPDFADVLEVFAREGARFVTEGEIARALVGLCGAGGHLGADDLKAYRHQWRTPLSHSRGAQIALNPGPSLGGPLVALALELAPDRPTPRALAEIFRATGAARLAAEDDPAALGDPALMAPIRRALGQRLQATRGTTHISVIDSQGLGVALTLSNGEGCGEILPGTGIMPNNMLGEADLIPGAAEGDWTSWPTDRRLASMMCPMALRWSDGRLAMLGSGGSNRIRTALTQTILNLTDRAMPLADAIEAPRLHVEGEALDFEEAGLPEPDRIALLDAFSEAQAWPEPSMFFGGAHGAIRHPKGGMEAAGDPRRAGVAITG
ncbi:MAG: gamma-glutamyltransferase [Pseudomonadota bacterium]